MKEALQVKSTKKYDHQNFIAPQITNQQKKGKARCHFLVTLTMTGFLTSCGSSPQKQRYNDAQYTKTRIIKNTRRIKGNIYTLQKVNTINENLISNEEYQKLTKFYEKWGKNPYLPKNPPKLKKWKWDFEPVQYTRTDIKEHSKQFNKEVRGRNRLFLFSFLLMLSPILLAL